MVLTLKVFVLLKCETFSLNVLFCIKLGSGQIMTAFSQTHWTWVSVAGLKLAKTSRNM